MLAKFGLTSPFNKRKIKEPSNIKEEMLQGQHNSTSNMSTPFNIATSGISTSGIPQKKYTTQSNQNKPNVSGLPVFSQQTPKKKLLVQPSVIVNNLNKSAEQKLCIGVGSYSNSKLTESKLSGLSFTSVRTVSNSNKTSRSASPTDTNSITASNCNLMSTSNSTSRSNISIRQTTRKLPQQISTPKKQSLNPTQQLAKPQASGIKPPTSIQTPCKTNGTYSTVSKLQAPSTSKIQSNLKSDSEVKLAKKLSSLITPANTVDLKSLKPDVPETPNKQTKLQSPSLPVKQKTSNFGLSKLTKLNRPNSDLVDQSPLSSSVTKPEHISTTNNTPSNKTMATKISGISVMKPPTSKLKLPTSTHILHYSPVKTQKSTTNLENSNPSNKVYSNKNTSLLSSTGDSNEPSNRESKIHVDNSVPNKKELSITNLNNHESGSSKSSFDDSKFDEDIPELELKNDQILTIKSYQQKFTLNTCNDGENSYAEIHSDLEMSATKILHSEEDVNAYNTVPNEESDDELLGINNANIKPVDDDNIEFQKFMNSDTNTISSRIFNNASINKLNNRNMNNQNNQMSMLTSPPLPPPPLSLSNRNYNQTNVNLPSPPPLPCQKFNSFGRSNTLDRKSKQSPFNFTEISRQSHNPFYNSLERKTLTDSSSESSNNYRLFSTMKNQLKQNQQSPKLVYHGSPQRNSLNLTIKPPSPQTPSHRNIGETSCFNKRPMSQDTILENTAHLAEFQQRMSSTPTSPEHYGCLSQGQVMSSIASLKLELENAKNQIFLLTNQLSTSGQVVNTLEQSVSSLTFKLQKQTYTCQKKERTISELKSYIDFIHNKYAKIFEADKHNPPTFINQCLNRQLSTESLNSLSSMFSQRTNAANSFLNDSFNSMPISNETNGTNETSKSPSKTKSKNWLRSSFRKAFNRKNPSENLSAESAKMLPSSAPKCLSDVDENDMAKNRISEFNDSNIYNHLNMNGEFSLPNSPMHFKPHQQHTPLKMSPLIDEASLQQEYHRVLRQKECQLTDVRLEALATAHQLDSQKEENAKMRLEIEALKLENAKIQSFFSSQFNSHTGNKITPHQSICSTLSSPSPSSSISSSSKLNLSLSTNHVDTSSSSILTPHSHKSQIKSPTIIDQLSGDLKRVCLSIYLGETDPISDQQANNQIFIGSLNITTRTNWDNLDSQIKQSFRDYIDRLESNNTPSLGLDINSIMCYYVGEMPRMGSPKLPDLLPYGYLVGNHTNIVIQLKTVSSGFLADIDMLCYETLVPRTRMQGYISLILEYKNLLFCGPSGTCKSYLARKLGEFLVRRVDGDVETSIAYLNVEDKSSKELKQFLNSVNEQASVGTGEIPLVLILDNLQNIGNNSDVFQEFFSVKKAQNKCSYVIGTINQSDVSSLNLHQSFKWVLCANHTEPVSNYLHRFLQRRLIDFEINTSGGGNSNDLQKIVEWMPRLWQHINKYIEQYNSSDLTLGPKIFAAVPLDYNKSMMWFIELWNNHIVPFMIETIKEGVQVYGTKMSWEDPKSWVVSTFPWVTYDLSVLNSLYAIEPHHVGFDTDTESSGKISSSNDDDMEKEKDFDDLDNLASLNLETSVEESGHQFVNNANDKLLNMLIRLQECTGGSTPSRPMSSVSGCGYTSNYDLNSIHLNESSI